MRRLKYSISLIKFIEIYGKLFSGLNIETKTADWMEGSWNVMRKLEAAIQRNR